MKLRLLLIAWVVVLLAACQGPSETPAASETPISTGDASAAAPLSQLQIILVSTDFAVGEPRISFVVFDGENSAADLAGIRVNALELDEDLSGTDLEPVWSGEATGYADYEVPYWTFYPILDKPGYYGMVAEITLEDGTETRADFLVQVLADNVAPAIGEEPPPSVNRTLATQPDITLLSSDNEPDPAFHELTVADAMASGRPTVVGFLTPAFCQTRWCAPVLQSMKEARAATGDAVNYIHIEVYDDFQEMTLTKELAEWGLESEPWVFVLDGEGRVAARFAGPVSPEELLAALQPLS